MQASIYTDTLKPAWPHCLAHVANIRLAGIVACIGILLAHTALADVSANTLTNLPPQVAQALQQSGIPDSHIGLVVQEIDGTPLLVHGGDRALNPASVMKLLTTLATLDRLGPAHTFKTTVWLDGPLKEGVLSGNLVLQGGGDPGMTVERFWLMLREMRLRGLREIQGDVLLDNRLYALNAQDPAAFDQAPLRPYNAPIAPLLVNFNTYSLRIHHEGEQPSVQLDPPAPGIHLDNRLHGSEGPCNGNGSRITTRLHESTLIIEGQYSRTCGVRSEALNLQTPQTTMADWFKAVWSELGGVLHGQVKVLQEGHAGPVNAGSINSGSLSPNPMSPAESISGPAATEFAKFDSPPLSLLVRDVNKFSSNVMAKMLLLNLAAAQLGAPATPEKGDTAIRTWLTERNLHQPELVLENGAGLSRVERMTAAGIANLLVWAAHQPIYYEFAASLPAVGVDGTQKNRFNDIQTAGKAWLKSGTLRGVSNIAGYVLGPDGQRRILVLLINHPNANLSLPVQHALLEWAMLTPAAHPQAIHQNSAKFSDKPVN